MLLYNEEIVLHKQYHSVRQYFAHFQIRNLHPHEQQLLCKSTKCILSTYQLVFEFHC